MTTDIGTDSSAGTMRKRQIASKSKDDNKYDNEKIKTKNNEIMAKKPSKVKAWIEASRPHTLTASVVPVIVGYVLTSTSTTVEDRGLLLRITISFAIFANLVQLGTNVHNDYADFVKGTDTDQRVGQARATQKGWLSPFETACGATLLLFLAFIIGMSLAIEASSASGGLDAIWTFITMSSVFNAVAYTGGPYPLGYIGLGNLSIGYSGLGDIFVLAYFGFVATMGVPYLFTQITASTQQQQYLLMEKACWMAVPIGFLATGIIVVNNLRDRHTDIHTRKMTLAVRFGESFARLEYAALIILSYIILIPFSIWYNSYYYLLPFISIPMSITQLKAVALKDGKDGSALNPHVGGTAKVQLLYCLLLCVAIQLSSGQ